MLDAVSNTRGATGAPARRAALEPKLPEMPPVMQATLLGGAIGFTPGLVLGVTLADRIPFKSYGGSLAVYLGSIGAGMVIGGLVGHLLAANQ